MSLTVSFVFLFQISQLLIILKHPGSEITSIHQVILPKTWNTKRISPFNLIFYEYTQLSAFEVQLTLNTFIIVDILASHTKHLHLSWLSWFSYKCLIAITMETWVQKKKSISHHFHFNRICANFIRGGLSISEIASNRWKVSCCKMRKDKSSSLFMWFRLTYILFYSLLDFP